MSYRIVDNMFGGPSAWPGMGSLLSYFVGGISNRNMDVPCSTTGLTPREKEAVRVTWELVKQDLKGVGTELLKSFFVANPTYQQYFKAFKDVPLDDLPGNSRFQAHSMSVMYALCSVVEHLDDPTVLVEMLQKLGESHGKRNIKAKHFQDLKVVLMKLLKTKLGSNFSEEEEKAWERTVNVAYSIILPALEKDDS